MNFQGRNKISVGKEDFWGQWNTDAQRYRFVLLMVELYMHILALLRLKSYNIIRFMNLINNDISMTISQA